MKKIMADYIVDCQLEWARRENIPLQGRYTMRVEDNILGGELHPETNKEYEKGKGHELEGKRAHMKALHSSSALVVNVFDYWRRQDRIQDIAKYCDAEGIINGMEFEKIHSIKGVTRKRPHLDIEFAGLIPLAIESKFTETYYQRTRRDNRDTHLHTYLRHREIWNFIPGIEALAESIVEKSRDRTNFEYLDVPQLIKHILGLKCSYDQEFSLLYLWYKVESKEATQHEQELADFRNRINGELKFRKMTYQELFGRIQRVPNVDSGYLAYLEKRYFSIS